MKSALLLFSVLLLSVSAVLSQEDETAVPETATPLNPDSEEQLMSGENEVGTEPREIPPACLARGDNHT
ncbi:hypothetical protein INR49_024700 [Caranx melampygus]|nr:hypothetical protein INR49_024700 [Caranx melampygus]